jgi:microsomal epoxide hydrolase
VKYWKEKFDWRAQEKKLNAFPQYRTQINGIMVHFYSVPPTKQGRESSEN